MQRDKFIKRFKGCGVLMMLGLNLLAIGLYFGMPYYQQYANSKLIRAAYDDDFNEVKRWVQLGADVNGVDISAPLYLAVANENRLIYEYLLKLGADVNLSIKDKFPIHELVVLNGQNT